MKKMRKVVSAILCMVMLIGILPVGLVSAEGIISWVAMSPSYKSVYFDDQVGMWCASTGDTTYYLSGDGKVKFDSTKYNSCTKINDDTYFWSNYTYGDSAVSKGAFYDSHGEIINNSGEYYRIIRSIENEDFLWIHGLDGKRGIMNDKMQVIVPAKYDSVDFDGDGISAEIKDTKLVKYDLQGNELGVIEYKGLAGKFISDNFRIMSDQQGNYGVVDRSNNTIVPFSYKGLSKLTEETLIARNDEGAMGVIDLKGNIIIPFEYASMEKVSNTEVMVSKVVYVQKNGWSGNRTRYGIVNMKNEIVAPIIYEFMHKDPAGYWNVWNDENRMKGLLNEQWKEVIPCEYTDIWNVKGNVTVARKGDGLGVVNLKGELIVPCIYDYIDYLDGNYMVVWKNEKKGVVTSEGKHILPAEYVAVDNNPKGDLMWLKDDNTAGVITATGENVKCEIDGKILDFMQGNNDDYVVKTEKGFFFGKLRMMKPGAANKFILGIGLKTASVWGKLTDNDVAPKIKDSRTMLPARFVAENLGAEVSWDGTEKKVIIKSEDKEIVLKINSNIATVNGKEIKIDSPAFIENGRTYTPVRFIAEELGAKVEWDGVNRQVIITK